MTDTFEVIIASKLDSITKVMDGLQELIGQPTFAPHPDEELRKCTSPELVYLVALSQQVKALEVHAKVVLDTIHNRNSRVQTLKESLKVLGKCDDSKGGASIGW
jgi:hypothetical protein